MFSAVPFAILFAPEKTLSATPGEILNIFPNTVLP